MELLSSLFDDACPRDFDWDRFDAPDKSARLYPACWKAIACENVRRLVRFDSRKIDRAGSTRTHVNPTVVALMRRGFDSELANKVRRIGPTLAEACLMGLSMMFQARGVTR